MSVQRDPWPGAVDTSPANRQHAGRMPRWATASATIASFATQLVKGHQDIYVPLATASLAGALSAADKAKLDLMKVPTLRLNVAANTDLISGAALTAGTAADVWANQNFTATATGVYLVFIRFAVLVTAVAAAGEMSTRAIINSAGTPITVKLASGAYNAGGQAIAGTAAFCLVAGLPAGTNTIKLQVVSSVNGQGYCRANTVPLYEFAEIAILEVSV